MCLRLIAQYKEPFVSRCVCLYTIQNSSFYRVTIIIFIIPEIVFEICASQYLLNFPCIYGSTFSIYSNIMFNSIQRRMNNICSIIWCDSPFVIQVSKNPYDCCKHIENAVNSTRTCYFICFRLVFSIFFSNSIFLLYLSLHFPFFFWFYFVLWFSLHFFMRLFDCLQFSQPWIVNEFDEFECCCAQWHREFMLLLFLCCSSLFILVFMVHVLFPDTF